MAANKKTNDKPTTTPEKGTNDEVAKVQTGTTNEGANGDAPDQADPDGLIYTQADVDRFVSEAVAAAGANQPNIDEQVNAERQQILRALKGDGALPPDVREAVDKEMAKVRKEGFDAGKEEALEELAESNQDGKDDAGNDEELAEYSDEDDFHTVVGRGIILGIILKMPANYRAGGEQHKLNEVDEFLQTLDRGADRVVAVEIIKSLAESRPTELASPAYKDVVKRGLMIVHGEAPENDPHTDAANSPQAAAERMQLAAGGGGTAFPAEAMPSEPPAHLQGEELAAFQRMQQAMAG